MIRNSLTDVFFTKDDVENLHEGVLRVLSEVGVKIAVSYTHLDVYKRQAIRR